MIDLFHPPKLKLRQPDLIYSSEYGKMTPEEKRPELSAEERRKRHLANRAAQSKRYKLRRKALGKAPALVEAK